jgi:hypothetical protein
MKLKKLIAHTVLDVIEFEAEALKRLAIRTGWYRRTLRRTLERGQMRVSESFLDSLMEEELYDVEKTLTVILLTFREAIDSGSFSEGLLHDLVMWGHHARKKNKAEDLVEEAAAWRDYVRATGMN